MISKRGWVPGMLLLAGLAGPTVFAAGEDTLDLGVFTVSIERWTYEQEMSARIIREAYEVPYSDDPADRDKLRCWVEDRGWSKFAFLYCARMGDIKARSPSEIFDRSNLRGLGYGTFLQSARTVSRKQLEENIFGLSGNDQFNKEFVDLVFNGERPPRYFPSEEEIAGYWSLSEALETLEPNATREDINYLAMSKGLSRARYEEISRMIELFPSVSDAVAERSSPQGFRHAPGGRAD